MPHIYVTSRAVDASLAWLETHLQRLEEGRTDMGLAYAPLRRALIAEIRNPRSGRTVLEAGLVPLQNSTRSQTVISKSRLALKHFRAHVRPQLGVLTADWVNKRQPATDFAGCELTGGFHFRTTDTKGSPLLVYCHASDWKPGETEAFIELLAIVAEHREGLPRSSVYFYDLVKQERVLPKLSYKRARAKIEKTVQLLARMEAAV